MSNYMVEVGPGLGGTILMAVVGAVVVVAAEAAADRKIARIYWYLGGGCICVYVSSRTRSDIVGRLSKPQKRSKE